MKNFNYYKRFGEYLSWTDAHSRCEKDKAHLAILDNPKEAELLGIMANERVHVGFQYSDKHRTFFTLFGEYYILVNLLDQYYIKHYVLK